jgi:hypothetical protein
MPGIDWSYPLACLWGLVVIAALAGWGKLIEDVLQEPGQKKDFGLGMVAAMGMAFFLVVSGALLVFESFSKTFVVLFLVAGLACLVFQAWQGRVALGFGWPARPSVRLLALLVGLMIAFTYARAAAERTYNTCDDLAAYFAFPKMMLDSGTLLDPFSFRRLGALGGQAALQTLTLTFIPWKYGHLLDCGIALVILLALTYEQIGGSSFRASLVRLSFIILLLALPIPRINTASQLTGTVLILALLRAFDLVTEGILTGWRGPVLLAGLAAAGATLRAHNPFALAALGGGYFTWRLWIGGPQRASIAGQAALTAVVGLLFLAPWLITSDVSSGTFLYPIFKGNHRPEFETFSLNLSTAQTAAFIGFFFLETSYLVFFLPAFLINPGRARQSACILGLGLIAISIAFVSQYTFGTYFDLYRYLMPLGLGYFLYTGGIVARQIVQEESRTPAWSARSILAGVLAGLMLLWQVPSLRYSMPWGLRTIVAASDESLQLGVPDTLKGRPLAQVRDDYAKGFGYVPAGAKVLIALDYPFLLDFSKHRFYSVDVEGAVSPDPGLPYFQGPEAVRRYLQRLGIRYIAHVPFDNSTYLQSRSAETANLNGPVAMWHLYGTYSLDFMKNVDEVARKYPVIYQSDSLIIIDFSK